MRFSFTKNLVCFFIIFSGMIIISGCARKSRSNYSPKIRRSGSSSSRVSGLFHSLAKGENLWELYKMYGVDVDTIKAMNPHLGRESALQIGESVFIPGRAEKLLSSKHSYLKRTKKKSSGKSTPGTIRSPGTIQAPRKSSVKKGSKVNTQKETSSAAQKKQINTDSREKINYSLGKKGPVSFLMPMQNSRASVLYGEGKGVFANGIVVQSPSDDKVRAVSAGTVEYAGQVDKLGEVIIISHSKNFFSLYADVKRPLVVLGETMQAGEPVAVAKDSFDSAGKRVFSVYFELRSNDDPVNPMSLISH